MGYYLESVYSGSGLFWGGSPTRTKRSVHQLILLGMLILIGLGAAPHTAEAASVCFGPKTDYGTGNGPYSVAVGDFDRGGKADLGGANKANASGRRSIPPLCRLAV